MWALWNALSCSAFRSALPFPDPASTAGHPAVKKRTDTINLLRIHCFGSKFYVYQYFVFTSFAVCRISGDHRIRTDLDEMFVTAFRAFVPLEFHAIAAFLLFR